MYTLAFRNLLRKRLRSALSLVGLSVAIVLVIGLISFSNGVRLLVENTLRQVEGLMVVERGAPDPILSRLPLEQGQALARLPGVRHVIPEVVWAVIWINGKLGHQLGLEGGGVMLLGIDPDQTARLPDGGIFRRGLREGRFVRAGEHDAVVLSRDLSQKLKQPVGSQVDLAGRSFRVVGLFETGSLILDRTVVVSIEAARSLRGMKPDEVSAFFLDIRGRAAQERAAELINSGARFEKLRAFTPEEANRTVGEILEKLDKLLWVITILPILGAGVAITNTMMMSFSERVREFGILKAVGWRRREVLALVITESLLLGAGGGLLGCLAGSGATWALGSYLAVKPYTPAWLYAACLLLSALLGVAGGAYPAYRAASLTPIEAIRHE